MFKISISKISLLIFICLSLQCSGASALMLCSHLFNRSSLSETDVGVFFHFSAAWHYSLEKDSIKNDIFPERITDGIEGFVRELPKMTDPWAYYSVITIPAAKRKEMQNGDIIELKGLIPAFPKNSRRIEFAKKFALEDAKKGRPNPSVIVSLKGPSGRDIRFLNYFSKEELGPKDDPWVVYLPGTRYFAHFIKVDGIEILQLTEVPH